MGDLLDGLSASEVLGTGGGVRVTEGYGVAAPPARRQSQDPGCVTVLVEGDWAGSHAQGICRQHDVL